MDLLTPSKKIPLANLEMIGTRPEPVVPDGVWVEVQGKILNNEAMHDAQCEEERMKQTHEQKNAVLKKFQKDVRKRVTQAAIANKKIINETQSAKMEKERELLYRSASAAERSTPKKNRCTYNVNPITIDSTGKLTATPKLVDPAELSKVDPVLQICSQRLESLTTGARQKLAERSIVPRKADLECENDDVPLPGGFWGVGATREKSKARLSNDNKDLDTTHHTVKPHNVEDDVDTVPAAPSLEDVTLASLQEGISAELVSNHRIEKETLKRSGKGEKDFFPQDPSHPYVASNVHFKLPDEILDEDDDLSEEFAQKSNVTRSIPACSEPDGNYDLVAYPKLKSSSSKPASALSAPPVVHPGVVARNQKMAVEKARWLSRRVFADAERERSREHKRLKEHRLRVERLRAEKEKIRWEIEEKSREQVQAVSLANEKLIKQAERQERKIKQKKTKEKKQQQKIERFVSALRAQLKDRLKQNKIELPPLCMCGNTFWDTNPNSCANNCIFYRNPKAFAKALEAVLQAVDRNMDPFHKDALQRSTVSFSLAPDDDDDDPEDITIPTSARTLSARSDHSSLLSLGSL